MRKLLKLIPKKLSIILCLIIISFVLALTFTKSPELTNKITLRPTSEIISVSGVEILSSNFYVDASGLCHIVGEVKNISENNTIIEIVAHLYNGENNRIGFGWGFASILVLTPGEKSPFEILISRLKADVKLYKLKAKFGTTTQKPYEGIKILWAESYTDNFGHFRVEGEVKNEGNQDVTLVRAVGTFYDITRAIATDSTWTNPKNLCVNGVAQFELVVTDKVLSYEIDNFSLQIWTLHGLYIVSPKW